MTELPQPGAASALFFDFDGTLVDLAPKPDLIVMPADLPHKLDRLAGRFGGALALVSGRPLDQIDHWLRPLRLPVAGVHGSERRSFDGRLTRLEVPELAALADRLQVWCDAHPGLLLERKPAAIALHFRGADELEVACVCAMEAAALELPNFSLMRGKKVLELKPTAANKGAALRAFLGEVPFAGRRPYFFGDDVTDEAGFEAIREFDGVAVKVGAGESLAPFRLPDPAAVLRWIDQVLASGRNESFEVAVD
ncbi:MAG: trehalose-phosphatase [Ideonella sp.]